jgi:hypothetical protein
MNRRILIASAIAAGLTYLTTSADAATAHERSLLQAESTHCVGPASGCSRTLAAGIKAARDGDTITIAPGSYAGATVDKSVELVGAGARSTTLRGGGPVLTIGAKGRASRLTVSISGITVTGGVSAASPQAGCGPDIPTCGPGYPRATALAGGIEVLSNAEVMITDSVVSGNRAAPTVTVKSVGATCPDGPCPFAQAAGGGIDNWGTLTLTRTTVSGNEASGELTAQANGGGIVSELHSQITLIHTTVTGNRAVAAANGRFASGGGIYVDRFGTLTVQDSVVSKNLSSLSSRYPKSVGEMDGNSGGIYVANGGTATIDGTAITGNTVVVDDPLGDPVGFDGGMCVCGPRTSLTMRDSTVANNHVNVTVGTSTVAKGGSGGALEADGDAAISDAHITGNAVVVKSPAGVALAIAALNLFDEGRKPATLSDSLISGNTLQASSTTGSAQIQGVGLANNGPAVLTNVRIIGNTGKVTAPNGWIHGGGIFNGHVFARPTPALTLQSTAVTKNSITGSAGTSIEGGGLYTKGFPSHRSQSVIAGNTPDQCAGC